METLERIEDDSMAKKLGDGKDELNLAEFPLCALAHRLQDLLRERVSIGAEAG